MITAKTLPRLWVTPVAQWRQHLTAAGHSSGTMTTRIQHLSQVARYLQSSPWEITTEQLISWSSGHEWSRETRRGIHTSLRQFYLWATENGHTDTNPAAKLPRVKAGPASPRPVPAAVLASALRAADERVLLILRCAVEAGMRRAEIAQIHERDLVEEYAGWTLLVHGKGGKDRMLPINPSLARALRTAFLASSNGYAFPGHCSGHISPRWVGKLATTVIPGTWTLHTLRHRFSTDMWIQTRDLLLIQQALGHASVATTQRYVKVPDDALREAMAARTAA